MAIVPRFSRAEFERMFNESVQDSVMVSYLANLMRAQVSALWVLYCAGVLHAQLAPNFACTACPWVLLMGVDQSAHRAALSACARQLECGEQMHEALWDAIVVLFSTHKPRMKQELDDSSRVLLDASCRKHDSLFAAC